LAAGQPYLGRRGQRRDRPVRVAETRIDVTVHQLEELDGELDVDQPACPDLDLRLGVFARPQALTLDARFDPADLAQRLLRQLGAEQVRPDQLGELVTERLVPRDRSRFQQRLELPWARPPFVVRAVR